MPHSSVFQIELLELTRVVFLAVAIPELTAAMTIHTESHHGKRKQLQDNYKFSAE